MYGGDITSLFPHINGAVVEVWEKISNFTHHFTGHVIVIHIVINVAPFTNMV